MRIYTTIISLAALLIMIMLLVAGCSRIGESEVAKVASNHVQQYLGPVDDFKLSTIKTSHGWSVKIVPTDDAAGKYLNISFPVVIEISRSGTVTGAM